MFLAGITMLLLLVGSFFIGAWLQAAENKRLSDLSDDDRYPLL